ERPGLHLADVQLRERVAGIDDGEDGEDLRWQAAAHQDAQGAAGDDQAVDAPVSAARHRRHARRFRAAEAGAGAAAHVHRDDAAVFLKSWGPALAGPSHAGPEEQAPATLAMMRSLVGAFVLAILFAAHAHAQAPDTVLLNGKIVTVDARSSVREALAIRDGYIVALGTSAEMRKLAGPR